MRCASIPVLWSIAEVPTAPRNAERDDVLRLLVIVLKSIFPLGIERDEE